jgi:hypothetical protein
MLHHASSVQLRLVYPSMFSNLSYTSTAYQLVILLSPDIPSLRHSSNRTAPTVTHRSTQRNHTLDRSLQDRNPIPINTAIQIVIQDVKDLPHTSLPSLAKFASFSCHIHIRKSQVPNLIPKTSLQPPRFHLHTHIHIRNSTVDPSSNPDGSKKRK